MDPRFNQVSPTRRIAFLAVMTALCVVGRFLFQFIPNVQPVTTIVIFLTLTYGVSTGLIVAILSMLITNLFMGMGIWTLAQLGAYAAVVVLTALLGKLPVVQHKLLWQTGLAAGMGFVYGFFVSILQAPLLGGLWPAIAYWLSGLSFDALHAGGNLILYPLLAPALTAVVQRKAVFGGKSW